MSNALVIGSGGLRGAYSAGVTATLCRHLGFNYFDKIYMSSVGAYAGSYYAAGQPDIIESVCRCHVHGNLLVNPVNALRGESILDLDYLIGLFKYGPFRLHAETAVHRVCFTMTDCETAEPWYCLPEDSAEVFLFMRATTAIPFFHPPVRIADRKMMDGSLSDPLPIAKALADHHERIVVVCNKTHVRLDGATQTFLKLACLRHWRITRKLTKNFHRSWKLTDELLQNERSISVIRPTQELPLRWALDSSKERINRSFDLGIRDALAFLNT